MMASSADTRNDALQAVSSDLDLLNHNTEQDFLDIGEKLAGFIETAGLISSELAALANWEQGLRASEALRRSLDIFRQMQAHQTGYAGLKNARRELARLKQALSGFEGIVSAVHMLGVYTRIETARLDNAESGFGGLADDVKSLAKNVQARVVSALEIADSLMQPIESAIQSISSIEEGQAKDLPSIIADVLRNLSSFQNIQDTVQASSVRLVGQYGAISDGFRKMIVSIQFHDITRQQIEHVSEVLHRLCSESLPNADGLHTGQRTLPVILALQSAQLADAGAKFAASVSSVEQNLDQIPQRVLEMVQESRTLAGLYAHEDGSFLVQMQQGCGAILNNFQQRAEAEAALVAAGDYLATIIARMQRPFDEIRLIESQMQRMALNARISANHLGPAGGTLDALAGSLQQLSAECKERSALLVEARESLAAATASSDQRSSAESAGEQGSRDKHIAEMSAAIRELHASSERNSAKIAQVVSRSAKLGESLFVTRNGFVVGDLFTQSLSSAQRRLEEIEMEFRSDLLRDGLELLVPDLSEFAHHYTMQAERDVYDRFHGISGHGDHASETMIPLDLAAAEGSAIEDSVEFF
jgi:hypothetical protein